MRYILDDNGYIDSVSCTPFNCKDKSCTEYTGTIPEGYGKAGGGNEEIALPDYNETSTLNGITATKNDDGSVTINGTDNNSIMWFGEGMMYLDNPIPLTAGTYTFTVEQSGTLEGNCAVTIMTASDNQFLVECGKQTSSTLTLESDDSIFAILVAFEPGTVLTDFTIKLKLEKVTAVEYTKEEYEAALAEWAQNANIRAYKIVEGNLTLDEAKVSELEAEWERQGKKILWRGASYMNAAQTAELSEPISAQLNGIILAWSRYNSGAKDEAWNYTFVPKQHIEFSSSGELSCVIATAGLQQMGCKTLNVSDTVITGHANNNTTGTGSSISWANNAFVLRYVLGV